MPQRKLSPPPAVLEIAKRLRQHGHAAWAVGGAVRDAWLGIHGGDWDLATDARPDAVRRIFRRTVPIGIEHGTVGVIASDGVLYEVTTFRRDVETFGRHAVIAFADTIGEDLERRDFTINAIAWDPIDDVLIDPHDGVRDLEERRLRTVGHASDRMAEDYLRALRALRFAGHYGLTIDAETWGAIRAAVPHLLNLSAERIHEELTKILTKTPHASATLRLYGESGALEALYPELAATRAVEMPGIDARTGRGADSGLANMDAWALAIAAVDAVPPRHVLVRYAALLHAIGVPAARIRDPLRGGWRVTGHESIGARKAGDVMQRLRASNADTERIVSLVGRQSDLFPPDAPDTGVRRWLADVGVSLVRDLFRLRIAFWRANPVKRGASDLVERWRKAHRVQLSHPVLTIDGLAIDGEDLKRLGMAPGPRFGQILRALLARVVDEPSLNTRDALLDLVRAQGIES
ncbi:MAG: CCA tRNA nucleotidyltransferase [Longimicrobiales bacterium]